MKLLNVIKLGVASLVMAVSTYTSAGIITSNGSAVNPLSLGESFEDFYNWGNGNQYSSNTGLEVSNSVVAFMAEYQNDLALFMIFSGQNGAAGVANFDITGTEGGISYVDDPNNDPVNGSNVKLRYAQGRTDGIIYSGLQSDVWSIDVVFNHLKNINNLTFLTFDGQGTSSVLYTTSTVPEAFSVSSIDVSAVVSAPAISLLTLLGFGFVTYRRLRK